MGASEILCLQEGWLGQPRLCQEGLIDRISLATETYLTVAK